MTQTIESLAVRRARSRCAKVGIVGFSMGAAFAVKYLHAPLG